MDLSANMEKQERMIQMKRRKSVAALCTALTLAMGIAVGMPVFAQDTVSGTFDTNCTWEMADDQVVWTSNDPAFTITFRDGECCVDGTDISQEQNETTWEALEAAEPMLKRLYETDPVTALTFSDRVTAVNMSFWGFPLQQVDKIWLGDHVEAIGANAFEEMAVRRVLLPESLKTIDDMAFLRCEELETLTIPSQVETIGEWAFCTCSSLTDVTILSRDVQLDDSALGYTGYDGFELDAPLTPIEGMTIRGYADSTAEQYAEENGFTFIPLDAPGIVLCGDVDLDGTVSILDAVLLSKVASGSVTLNEDAMKNADCDADGTLSGNDAVVLLRFLVHLVDTLPCID